MAKTKKRRPRLSDELKRQVVAEALSGRWPKQAICRKYRISSTALYAWIHDKSLAPAAPGKKGLVYNPKTGRLRRVWTREQKLRIVEEALASSKEGTRSKADVSRSYGVKLSLLYKWIDAYKAGKLNPVQTPQVAEPDPAAGDLASQETALRVKIGNTVSQLIDELDDYLTLKHRRGTISPPLR